jgi:hypothetical protein
MPDGRGRGYELNIAIGAIIVHVFYFGSDIGVTGLVSVAGYDDRLTSVCHHYCVD